MQVKCKQISLPAQANQSWQKYQKLPETGLVRVVLRYAGKAFLGAQDQYSPLPQIWQAVGRVEHYPDRFRRVSYKDPESGKALVFLTNNFDLPALTIAQLYKSRWRVELFFKWIKQNLRIKHFFGTTDNAVKTQVWIAVCVYVLVASRRCKVGIPPGFLPTRSR